MLAAWMERDGASLDDMREAFVRMVERIEFNPDTGAGRIFYKIESPAGSGRFAVPNRCPLGQIGYRSFRVHR